MNREFQSKTHSNTSKQSIQMNTRKGFSMEPPIQRKPNKTGLPEDLKSGIENLSGHSLDDVKVHYNSPKPAQLQAHAYAQGSQIHLAPGQEKHLPHEAWHVVQQKQGRVKPTMLFQGKVNINDDSGLEKEADMMGEKAVEIGNAKSGSTIDNLDVQPKQKSSFNSQIIVAQRFLEGHDGTIYMGSAELYWRENEEYISSLWAKEGISVPSNIIELVSRLADRNVTEYSIADLTELVRDEGEKPTFDQHFESTFGEEARSTHRIERNIHRFWAGGKMSKTTMENLKAMQSKVSGSGWNHILWTDDKTNRAVGSEDLMGQLDELREMGMSVKDIRELGGIEERHHGFSDALESRSLASVIGVLGEEKNYMPVKFLSDFARLSATYAHGGVYMDTDIGPGSLDLGSSTLFHRDAEGEVPLAGPQVQNTQAYGRDLEGDESPRENLLRNTARRGQPVFNFFYATRANTQSNLRALEFMMKHERASGMEAATNHFYRAIDPREWMVPWISDLDWATAASDMEEGKGDEGSANESSIGGEAAELHVPDDD